MDSFDFIEQHPVLTIAAVTLLIFALKLIGVGKNAILWIAASSIVGLSLYAARVYG